MSLEVIHRGHSVSLVTVARMQRETVIGLAGIDEQELAELIEVASWDVASSYGIGREPWLQIYRETATASRKGDVLLSRWPVVRVDRVLDASGDDVEEEYSLVGASRNRISGLSPCCSYTVEYPAGWIPADLVLEWSPGVTLTTGWVITGELAAEVITPGLTGTEPPTWPTGEGETVEDGTATWRMAAADLAPQNLRRAAVVHVKEMALGEKDVPYGVVREGDDGGFTVYERPKSPFSPYCAAVVRGFR